MLYIVVTATPRLPDVPLADALVEYFVKSLKVTQGY